MACRSEDVPTQVTFYTTFGESPVVDGGTTTITEYKGESTLTVPGPQYITLTIFPTTTSFKTERHTVPTTTRTKTSTQAPPATQTVCRPGDSSVKERTGLKPTHDQSITLCECRNCRFGDGLLTILANSKTLSPFVSAVPLLLKMPY